MAMASVVFLEQCESVINLMQTHYEAEQSERSVPWLKPSWTHLCPCWTCGRRWWILGCFAGKGWDNQVEPPPVLQSSRITHRRDSLFSHGWYRRATGNVLFLINEAANSAQQIWIVSWWGDFLMKTQGSVWLRMSLDWCMCLVLKVCHSVQQQKRTKCKPWLLLLWSIAAELCCCCCRIWGEINGVWV